MDDSAIGRVLSIAVRTETRGAMREVEEGFADIDGGLKGDIKVSPNRGITFISSPQWKEVISELKADLPWHTRRANVLVDAPALGHLIGRSVRVGEVELKIEAETKPCQLMDMLHQGLRQALVPDFRGGVHGRVLKAGRFRIGDELELIA